MIRTVTVSACALALAAPAEAQKKSTPTTKPSTVKELVAALKTREKAVESAELRMVTRGSYPNGMSFEIKGTIRVLGKTHLHHVTQATFEDELTAISELVKTPKGVWMRERDPAYGEVFLSMQPEMAKKLEAASALLGDGVRVPGAAGNQMEAPLGSAMVESLDQHFALALERRFIKNEEFLIVAGDLRAGGEAIEEEEFPPPDRVELKVRALDYTVVEMVQFRKGNEIMRVTIEKLELNPRIDRASFAIKLPEGARFIDVMDHLPAAEQIRAVLADAEAKRAEQPAPKGKK